MSEFRHLGGGWGWRRRASTRRAWRWRSTTCTRAASSTGARPAPQAPPLLPAYPRFWWRRGHQPPRAQYVHNLGTTVRVPCLWSNLQVGAATSRPPVHPRPPYTQLCSHTRSQNTVTRHPGPGSSSTHKLFSVRGACLAPGATDGVPWCTRPVIRCRVRRGQAGCSA